jgi:hypothetical protein
VRAIEVEVTQTVKGESFLTGRKRRDYVHDQETIDDVRNFLASAASDMHIVILIKSCCPDLNHAESAH